MQSSLGSSFAKKLTDDKPAFKERNNDTSMFLEGRCFVHSRLSQRKIKKVG